ncbi:MAG: hypothetical protein ABI851_12800 [Saprospiraceae bacterium]
MKTISALAFFFNINILLGEEVIQLNLDEPINSQSIIIDPKKEYSLEILNLRSDWSYSISIGKEREIYSPFSIKNQEIPKALIKQTKVYKLGKIKQGEIIKIVVIGSDSSSTKKWELILKSTPRGTWITTYGVNHVTNWFRASDYYYSEAVGNMYAIRKEDTSDQRENWLEIKPSITFRWFPNNKVLAKIDNSSFFQNFDLSIVGGLGIDFKDPNVLLGLGLSYNQNLSIDFGLTTNMVSTLKGKYYKDQIINVQISESDLVKKIIVVNPFINISFRLDKDIFKEAAE